MIYVGIDCGKHGGIAILKPGRWLRAFHTPVTVTTFKFPRKKTEAGNPAVKRTETYNVLVMYKLLQLVQRLQQRGHRIVVGLERQWPRPEDGKSRVQSLAEGFATWWTLLNVLRLPVTLVSPTSWKPRYTVAGAAKEESVKACQRIYPHVSFSRKKDEARAEAILIADFLYRKETGRSYPRTPDRRRLVKPAEEAPKRKRKRRKRLSVLMGGRAQRRMR